VMIGMAKKTGDVVRIRPAALNGIFGAGQF
jgi:hypothetical protein